jgi:peptidoglycan/xylan/chitin deacetylase (PgdA/CDA1 family)
MRRIQSARLTQTFVRVLTFFGILIAVTCNIAVAATTDQLANAGIETAGATGATKAFDWQDYGAGYNRVATHHTGTWGISLKQSSSASSPVGAYQRIDLNQKEKNPVFIGAYLKGTNLINNTNSFLAASVYAEIHLTNGKTVYWNSISNKGTFDWRWIGFNTGTLSGVDAPISYIFIVPILAGTTGTAYFDDFQVVEYKPLTSALTVMIDDGEDSTYTQAKPIMDKYGFVGSSAVIVNYAGQQGYMTWAQVTALSKAGWEIVSHGLNHVDLTTVTAATLKAELSSSLTMLKSKGLTVNNFAIPFGAYNGGVLATGAKYYKSMRLYEQGSNPQGTFPYDVKVRGVLDTTTPEDISAWIKDAQKNKQWIVLTFHSVAASGEDAYHVSPAIFDKMMQTIKASGIQVMTYNSAFDAFKTTPTAASTVFGQ